MNAERLLQHFDRVAEAPNAVAHLRRFILDLAVRGKLVDQDPNDEPASELLKQIQVEKERLVKEGEIKKQKPLLPIAMEDEPFSIPKNWCWVKLYEITSYIQRGKSPKYATHDGFPVISQKCVQWDGLNLSAARIVTKESIKSYEKIRFLQNGDLLWNSTGTGTIGRIIRLNAPQEKLICDSHVTVVRCLEVEPEFIRTWLRSDHVYGVIESKATGATNQVELTAQMTTNQAVPLPPLAEQHRIVAKVDELMGLCDRLESAQQNRESQRDRLVAASLHHLNQSADGDRSRFYFNNLSRLTMRSEHIKALRQTIFNLAVRGKLVEQDSNDEPAWELLKEIQAEKQQLLKEGKIKRDAILPPIDDVESPFSLPSGWTWARFPELGIFGRGKSKHRPRNDPSLFKDGTHLFVQTGDVARSNGIIQTYSGKYNEFGLAQSSKWVKGTLCITITANIADSGILSFDACFPDSIVGFIPASIFSEARYFEYFIRTAKANLLEFAPATAQKNINLGILNAVLIPLPPLAEQQRIVAKVDELMGLCDRLETQLSITQSNSRRLRESLLHEALTPST
jgi:type I restriction enzyme, S subunit